MENPHLWFEIVPPTGEYGIRGSTPAEKTGIKIEGSSKWLTLIQNADVESKKKYLKKPKSVSALELRANEAKN